MPPKNTSVSPANRRTPRKAGRDGGQVSSGDEQATSSAKDTRTAPPSTEPDATPDRKSKKGAKGTKSVKKNCESPSSITCALQAAANGVHNAIVFVRHMSFAHWMTFGGLFFVCAVMYMKVREETFAQFGEFSYSAVDTDHYEALGLSRKATANEIRTSYRRLSLRWHPDKNPECEACMEKFRAITEAHTVLADPEAKRVYDESAMSTETIDSQTLTLTKRNYHKLVTNSRNTVWIVQLYKDYDYFCRSFKSLWDSAADTLEPHVKFGRINVTKEPEIAKLLPMRSNLYPAVFTLVPSKAPQVFDEILTATKPQFVTWITKQFPKHMIGAKTGEEIQTYLSADTQPPLGGGKILLFAPSTVVPLEFSRIALTWKSVFKFLVASSSLMPDELKPDQPKHYPVLALDADMSIRASSTYIHTTAEKGTTLEKALQVFQEHFAPFLTAQNFNTLCDRENSEIKIYCLVLVEVEGESTADEYQAEAQRVVAAVHKAKQAYHPDEPEGGEEEAQTELTSLVQVVRLSSSGSFAASLNFKRPEHSAPPRFYWYWAGALKRQTTLLIDLERERISTRITPSDEGLENFYFDLEDGVTGFQPWQSGICGPSDFALRCLADTDFRWANWMVHKFRTMSWTQWSAVAVAIIAGLHLVSNYKKMKADRLAEELQRES